MNEGPNGNVIKGPWGAPHKSQSTEGPVGKESADIVIMPQRGSLGREDYESVDETVVEKYSRVKGQVDRVIAILRQPENIQDPQNTIIVTALIKYLDTLENVYTAHIERGDTITEEALHDALNDLEAYFKQGREE